MTDDTESNVVPFTGFSVTAEGVKPLESTAPTATVTTSTNSAPSAAAAPAVVRGRKKKEPSLPSQETEADEADEESAGDPSAAAPAAGDITDAFESKPGVEEYYYNADLSRFMRRNTAGRWITLNEGAFLRYLKKERRLRDKPAPGKLTSPAHDVLCEVENDRRVDYAGVIAGYKSGLHEIGGRRVLVTEDPKYITPAKGEFPLLTRYLDHLFCGEEPGADGGPSIKIDQRPYVFGWLQHVTQCYYAGRPAEGLAFCLAGDTGTGKSFFSLLVRWILGERVAKPYKFMMNDDSFNRDLIEAVLQLIDDENQTDTDYKARQKFAGEVKMIVANNEFRVRAMHTDPFAIPVLRRLMVLCNLQGTRLLVLPPLDGDIDGKLFLFKAYPPPLPTGDLSTWCGGLPTIDTPAEQACWPMPMPTRTEEEKEAWRAAVRSELPAFLWWLLNEYKMPTQVSGGRWIVRHYHHPAIVSALLEHAPQTRLWDLIVRSRVVFQEYIPPGGPDEPAEWTVRKDGWSGTAGDLEQLLKKSEACQLSKDERAEIKASNWLGRTLESCGEHFGKDYCDGSKRTAKGRIWHLRPRKEDAL